MIKLKKSAVFDAALKRPAGYLQDIAAGIQAQDETFIWMDPKAYGAMREKYSVPSDRPPAPPPHGPGTELKALLASVGITATENCACNRRARTMDEMEAKEPGWCEQNIETICDWLEEEARKRSLPFVRAAGKMVVRRAIRNYRKKGNSQ